MKMSTSTFSKAIICHNKYETDNIDAMSDILNMTVELGSAGWRHLALDRLSN